MRLALLEPDIPQNTGAIARLADRMTDSSLEKLRKNYGRIPPEDVMLPPRPH